jgi:hypothetical protein
VIRNVSRPWRRVTAIALAAVAPALVVSCGESEERSLCTSFDEFVAAGTFIRAADLEALSAAEATDLAESYLQRVTQMQEVADGRYGAELDALEATADDLLRTLSSVQDDADFDTWAPLVSDTLEDVDAASLRVEQTIEPSCSPDVTEE